MPDPAEGILRLDVVVEDQSGKPVTGLRANDFTLFDNGRAQPIVSFKALDDTTHKPEHPAEIILVIDELNLTPIQVQAAEREAESFLSQNHGRLSNPVCIYRVNEWGLFASTQPSKDGNLVAEEMTRNKQMRTVWPSAMMSIAAQNKAGASPTEHVFLDPSWRELPHSLTALGAIAIEERRKPGRKLMFWLGPGWKFNHGRGKGLFDSVTELSTRLREARIELWNISAWPPSDSQGQPGVGTGAAYQDFLPPVKSEKDVTFGNLALQVIATQSGGRVIETAGEIGATIARYVADANSFYSLTFDPQRTDMVDDYHELQIKLDKLGLTGRTRSGYYDEPVFYDQPPFAEGITVEQLQQVLKQIAGKSDTDAARQLAGLELTERMSSAKLAILSAEVKGKRTREALIALADQSVFLPPPSADILLAKPPPIPDQRAIILRTVEYVKNFIPGLPDFFATRETAEYGERARKPGETWKTASPDQSLHLTETLKARVLFRGGKEVSEGRRTWGKSLLPGEAKLDTVGTFGPILRTVLAAATGSGSELQWARWEQDPSGRKAVFHYHVPPAAASFLVGFCCMAVDFRQVPFEKNAAIHGEFAIDPQTGAVLRLTVQADLEPTFQHSGIRSLEFT